jgi:hypothetical protein
VTPLTATGTLLETVLPFPSWPLILFPQHLTVPPASRAHVWSSALPPALIWVAVEMPLTATGTLLVAVVPFPSSP